MKKLFLKSKAKLACKKGDGHLVSVMGLIIAVVLIITLSISRGMKTSEGQWDKTDNAIDSMWNYGK
ncbi:MAG: hypothetical protein RSC41_03030 [Oscillospiraceae bacterium]